MRTNSVGSSWVNKTTLISTIVDSPSFFSHSAVNKTTLISTFHTLHLMLCMINQENKLHMPLSPYFLSS